MIAICWVSIEDARQKSLRYMILKLQKKRKETLLVVAIIITLRNFIQSLFQVGKKNEK